MTLSMLGKVALIIVAIVGVLLLIGPCTLVLFNLAGGGGVELSESKLNILIAQGLFGIVLIAAAMYALVRLDA